MCEDAVDFVFRQDNRHSYRFFGAFYAVEPADLLLQHLFVKEEQRREGLVLGRGGDLAIACQSSKEGGYFDFGHFRRVPFAVKQNVAPNPLCIRLLCSNAVML